MPFSESSLKPIYQLQYKEHSSALPTDQLNAPRTIGPRSRLGNAQRISVQQASREERCAHLGVPGAGRVRMAR